MSVALFDAFVPTVKPAVSFRKKVGYFGGWTTVKGVDVLMKAAMRLPDVLFVLFSNVPTEDLQGRRMYGLDNVVVVGGYSRSDLHLLVHLVDCVARTLTGSDFR